MPVANAFALSILIAVLAMTPAAAGTDEPDERSLSETLDDALQDFIEQMRPTFDEMLETFEVLEGIDSIENYEHPEFLPNGDIIMRRREDAPPLLREDDGDADKDPDAQPDVKI